MFCRNFVERVIFTPPWTSVAFTNPQLGDKFTDLTFNVHTNVFRGCRSFNKATFSPLKCQLMLRLFVSVTKINSALV